MISTSPRNLLRVATAGLCGFWRRIKTAFIATLVGLLAISGVTTAVLWGVDWDRNRTIAALTHNHDVRVATDAPQVMFARAYFLMTHGRLHAAQVLMSMLDRGGSRSLRADLHYDLANARLRRAFQRIDTGDIDGAKAQVGLAREDYRESLRLDPDNWNARFNFDVASRLVREYPNFALPPELRGRSQRGLWTEMPSTPQGEP